MCKLGGLYPALFNPTFFTSSKGPFLELSVSGPSAPPPVIRALPQGNQVLLVVKEKVGRPQVSLG